MTEIELELILDADMHLFIEKGMRGSIFYVAKRHSKANNDYPLAPEKLKIKCDMLSIYCSNIENDYWIKIVCADPIQNGEGERLPLQVFPLQLLQT